MSFYSKIGSVALSDADISRRAPSAFATEAHDSRSDRFSVIPTASVIAAMRREGFEPFSAKQSNTRDASRKEFTKHMIRFRHVSQPTETTGLAIGTIFPEVVLVNAQDGSSAYKLMAGLFRLICLNGMIVSQRSDGGVSVAHKGDVARRVIEGSYEVLKSSQRALVAADHWSQISLNRDEQLAFAEQARVLRFGDSEGVVTTPIQASQMLVTRRMSDQGDDLWTVFNRIQENAIKGGLSGRAPRDDRGRRGRLVTSKEVNGIDGDVRLNRALWALGERMAELRG